MPSPPFDAALSDEETLERLANFTFEEKHYAYALGYLNRLPSTPARLQKAGYAHQMLGDYAAAIKQYEHALYIEESLQPQPRRRCRRHPCPHHP